MQARAAVRGAETALRELKLTIERTRNSVILTGEFSEGLRACVLQTNKPRPSRRITSEHMNNCYRNAIVLMTLLFESRLLKKSESELQRSNQIRPRRHVTKKYNPPGRLSIKYRISTHWTAMF